MLAINKKIPVGQEETAEAIDILIGNTAKRSAVLDILKQLDQAKETTDPWNPHLKSQQVRALDDAGIYGNDIIKLHRLCHQDIHLTSACLRACTIPEIGLKPYDLRNAINGGASLQPKRVISEIQRFIPRFAKDTQHDPLVQRAAMKAPRPA